MWGIGTLVLTACHSRIKRELLSICLPTPPAPTPLLDLGLQQGQRRGMDSLMMKQSVEQTCRDKGTHMRDTGSN